ncbi:hypothetical protein [Flavobacterium sp.]|uniref:hypothetical protein n=1 Tax=Flavobacterium sp. TaxID=239 RepID=UPI0011F65654|nr:hypothetical protein [Flavobacterium sp.]RZJ70296.1 MAG: hypothetical protein EOO49_14290 [Flavobacterium sp.]
MTHYFAKAIDLSGAEIDLPVSEDGTVQISSVLKIKALKTNALKVFCRNNELEMLEAPDAISVGCNKNKLTSLQLQNAENVHCGENKLTELIAPKVTVVKCFLNKLTQLKLENAVDIECYGNNDLVSIIAPKLRKIEPAFEPFVKNEDFVLRKEIEIELKNQFNRKNPAGYKTESLDLKIALDLDKHRTFDDISFVVSLYDPAVMFEVYLMQLNDKFCQHETIVKQLDKLPFLADKPMSFEVSIPIFSTETETRNLLDIIREAPERERLYCPTFDLDVTFYLMSENQQDKIFIKTFSIDNPFYGRYQWETGQFTEPGEITSDDKNLPNALIDVSDKLEVALLELFEVHKTEISEIADAVDGISYDILPHERYAAVSFRTKSDYDEQEIPTYGNLTKYSPADWENYSLLEYRDCESAKFKAFSTWLFQLFFEIYSSSDDFEDKEARINDLLFLAIADAVLRPSIAAKLRGCGLTEAPTISEEFSTEIEYIVSASEYGKHFNYCEFLVAERKVKRAAASLRLDKF